MAAHAESPVGRAAARPALALVHSSGRDQLAEVSQISWRACVAHRSTKVIGWSAAVGKLGVPGLHFHDLRHTGNTIAARTGASTRELMARMGHDSPQAAMIYQHPPRRRIGPSPRR
jgi:integrase